MRILKYKIPLDDDELLVTLLCPYLVGSKRYIYDEKSTNIVCIWFPNMSINYTSEEIEVKDIEYESDIGNDIYANTIAYLHSIVDMPYVHGTTILSKKDKGKISIKN